MTRCCTSCLSLPHPLTGTPRLTSDQIQNLTVML
ncbi:hypothetical protein CsSME_00016203 [Camellia sinensis var. sinensis]